ncbi:MAG: RNA methyltransferase [Ferrimonas sp.]
MPEPHVIIALTNPKSPSNVGAVMRAAGCFGADEVRYSGVRYERAAKFQTDTKQVAKTIPLIGMDDLLAELPEDTKVVCVELVEGACPLPKFEHPKRAIYVFGPEDGNLSQAVVSASDAVVYMPTQGCLNLAASVNVLLYDRVAKEGGRQETGDALIRASRDTRNHLRVSEG